MTPEEKFRQQVWQVLQEIKGEIIASLDTEIGQPIQYIISNYIDSEFIPKNRRKKILYKLQESGIIDILSDYNGVKIGPEDIFYFFTDPSKFKKVYKKYENSQSIITQIKSKNPMLSKRELRKKINAILRLTKFGKKEKAFIKFLSKDFEPKKIKEISENILTKAPKKLKASVQKKIKGTGFQIKTDKGTWTPNSTYQLIYLPQSESI